MFDGPEPIYVQIAAWVRTQILAGDLADGDQVMSTTQLSTTFRLNPATAAKAYAGLVEEGLLVKRRGIGMFVADGARDALLAEHRRTFYTDVLDPALDRAALLGIPVDELVDHVRGHARTTPGGDPR